VLPQGKALVVGGRLTPPIKPPLHGWLDVLDVWSPLCSFFSFLLKNYLAEFSDHFKCHAYGILYHFYLYFFLFQYFTFFI
jgi:hypothetical protein